MGKANVYDELKRLAVNLGYAKSVDEVPGEDKADVLAYINDSMEAAASQKENEDQNASENQPKQGNQGN